MTPSWLTRVGWRVREDEALRRMTVVLSGRQSDVAVFRVGELVPLY